MQKKKFEKNNENDINVDENEINFYKDIIKNTKEASQNIKNIKNNNIKKLSLFRDIYKYYLSNNTYIDYIGSSVSIILINNNYIIAADIGISICILFRKEGKILNKKVSNEFLNSEYVFENKKRE